MKTRVTKVGCQSALADALNVGVQLSKKKLCVMVQLETDISRFNAEDIYRKDLMTKRRSEL